MVESRWLRWFGPGVVALGAVGLIASTTVEAGTRAWTPGDCGGPPGGRIEAARVARPVSPADLAGEPWFRLDPVAADDGSLRGERLALGRLGEAQARSLDLPAESFAAGPFGRTVLTGGDDGSRSRVSLVDVVNGCAWLVATERDVIRRATVDPAGTTIYEMRVDRATRADLGVWRRPLDGSAPAERFVEPIDPDVRFGMTFSTELSWDLAGDRLAIQSCGEFACRTRLVDPDDRSVATLDAPDLGLLIGVDGDVVVTYADCHGLPCPIVSTDIVSGVRSVLAGAAGAATVVGADGGARLVHETSTSSGLALRAVRLSGGAGQEIPMADDLRLAETPLTSSSATRLPRAWVLLAPDGSGTADTTDARFQLRRIPDGATVPLDEAVR